MKLSIIIPTYNEQTTIKHLIDYVRSAKYLIEYEIIIVDDASIDRTYEKELLIRLKSKAKSGNVRLFKNRINRGKGFSVRKGIRRASGDIIIVQDADTEYDPREIPRLISPIIEGKAAVVYGSRFLNKVRPKEMAFPNWVANKILTSFTNFLFKIKLTDMETCYKAIRADIAKDLKLKANRFTFEPEITALLAKRKIEIKEMPISYHGRSAKEGKKIKAKDFIFAILVLLWQRVIK
ncbi:MAG: glycosyltransferase family 2 protein [Candidatus Omnitrophota bacterium]|nr:MAG: glycosyltransferase family 2 protein [Candidatus Omnitrophota bacterium]